MTATLSGTFSDIADAIRAKSGTSSTYKPTQMAQAIIDIPTGGGTINNQNKTVTPTKQTQTITKDSNLYTGLGTVTVNPIPDLYIDTTAADATAADINAGKTAYVNGALITGTNALKYGVLRPDAELIQTYTYDKYIVEDEEITLPAYTTDSTVLKASENLTPTITLDYANYNYFVLEKMLTIPTYNISTKAKGRLEWLGSACLYEIFDIEGNVGKTILDGTYAADRTVSTLAVGAAHRLIYWSTSSKAAWYTSASYGTYQTVQAPSVSSGVLTIKSPILGIRGSTTYLTSTYFDAITDIRYQWKFEVYRVPKNPSKIQGWGTVSSIMHIIDNVNSNTHTLT